MRYYHGTDKDFEKFDLAVAQNYKDFGKGVYLAKDRKHAEAIAKKKNGKHAFVRIYDLNIEDMRSVLKVKVFKKTSLDWVKFVLVNRNEIIHTDYDVVVGATADAKAQDLLEEFYHKHKNVNPSVKEYRELISKLAVYRYSTQICLLTQSAVDYVERQYVDNVDINLGGHI